ncbi:hypothetical protein ND2E_4172 [Colwellia psychrerythraea]|uniref:Transposase IS4 family protein n=1 Tax=Colwellia psychrerythraea TaxID=28229 RepID=A0A099KD87_COLPS|nr:ISAs1 family transposase [Colwellia psychrerythraea]KGJ88336.1 hypothetical protein ND2E_4172 [Colwellia psychrerythraea]
MKDATITMDAMGCQFVIADKIVEAQANYVLALKDNQGEFHDDIKLFLETNLANKFKNISHTVNKTVNGDHGRIEQRNVWLTSDIQWLIERHPRWKSMAENFSMMNKVALNLLENEKSIKVGVKTKRLKAGWDEAYMMKVITVGFTSV